MGSFTFENQGANTYLVYTIEDGSPLDMLSLGMLTNNNKIEGLVPVVYTQMDMTKFLKYNISSKISMQQYFQGTVTRKQVLRVFLSVTKAVLLAEEYMILPGSLLLDMDRIYIDVSSCSAELICLPLASKNASIDMGSFFRNIIFTARYAQNENCDYVASIINYLNSKQAYSLTEFKKLLEGLLDAGTMQQPAAVKDLELQGVQGKKIKGRDVPPNNRAQAIQQTSNTHPAQAKEVRQNVNTEPVNSKPQDSAAAKQDSNRKKSRFGLFKKKEKKEKQHKGSLNSQSSGVNTSGASGGAFIGMDIPGMPHGIEDMHNKGTSSNHMTSSASSRTDVSGNTNAAGTEAKNTSSKKVMQDVPQDIQLDMRQRTATNEAAAASAFVGTSFPEYPAGSQGQPANFGNTVVLAGSGAAGETSVLTDVEAQRQMKPCLIRVKSGEQIWIDASVFTLGREASYVHYCISDNSAVSKSHANIVTKGNQYYIVDTNSRNHTFLDGKMIVANEKRLLSNGSKIKLANEEFEFRLM